MDSQVAKVIPWNAKAKPAGEEATAGSAAEVRLSPLDGVVILIGDDQLDALATTFLMSPYRNAMTFEAYLAVKGFAREAG
ncbi:MAG: hypothetical protein ACREQ9_04655 [Candidatus Binatia bacterium]